MQKKEVLSIHYTNLLCEMLAKKGKDVRTIDEVFSNLSLLATKVKSFGDEEARFLPLSVKRMLAKALDPESRIVYNVSEHTKTELAVEAFFFWGHDSEYSGYGYSKKSLESLVLNSSSASEEELNFEALVKGAAASRALTDAGIGLEFFCDEFDALVTSMEENEAIETAIRKEEKERESFNEKVPNVPSIEQQKKTRTKQTVGNKNAGKELPLPSSTEGSSLEKDNFVNTTLPDTNELSKAKNTICDVGEFEGQTLGEIYAKNPRLLVKIARNPDSKVSNEAKALVISDGKYSQYLS